jgi:hypothetical protein
MGFMKAAKVSSIRTDAERARSEGRTCSSPGTGTR